MQLVLKLHLSILHHEQELRLIRKRSSWVILSISISLAIVHAHEQVKMIQEQHPQNNKII
jgi:hypothetical protein